MKQQLTPIPPHIRIKKCPPGIAEGSVLVPRGWRTGDTGEFSVPGCRRKRPFPTSSTPPLIEPID